MDKVRKGVDIQAVAVDSLPAWVGADNHLTLVDGDSRPVRAVDTHQVPVVGIHQVLVLDIHPVSVDGDSRLARLDAAGTDAGDLETGPAEVDSSSSARSFHRADIAPVGSTDVAVVVDAVQIPDCCQEGSPHREGGTVVGRMDLMVDCRSAG